MIAGPIVTLLTFALWILSMILSLILWISPWIAALFATKNRKLWLAWHKSKYRGTFWLALLCSVAKMLYLVASANLSYIGRGTMDTAFDESLIWWSFIDMVPVKLVHHLVQPLLQGLPFYSPEVLFFLLDFSVLFGLFFALRATKAFFAKRAYEVE
ncbi:MAG: hypothetical protein WCG75_03640 [Armatimonadota bacterium]